MKWFRILALSGVSLLMVGGCQDLGVLFGAEPPDGDRDEADGMEGGDAKVRIPEWDIDWEPGAEAPPAAPANCHPLTDICALPWPSSVHFRADENAKTGRRLVLAAETGFGDIGALLATEALDGVGALQPIVTQISAPIDPTILPITLEESLENGAIILVEASTGAGVVGGRHPFRAALTVSATDPDQQLLTIFPARALRAGLRYAVIITSELTDPKGLPLLPGPTMRMLLGEPPAEGEIPVEIAALAEEYADLGVLAEHHLGIERSQIIQAWSFWVRSDRDLFGPWRHAAANTVAALKTTPPDPSATPSPGKTIDGFRRFDLSWKAPKVTPAGDLDGAPTLWRDASGVLLLPDSIASDNHGTTGLLLIPPGERAYAVADTLIAMMQNQDAFGAALTQAGLALLVVDGGPVEGPVAEKGDAIAWNQGRAQAMANAVAAVGAAQWLHTVSDGEYSLFTQQVTVFTRGLEARTGLALSVWVEEVSAVAMMGGGAGPFAKWDALYAEGDAADSVDGLSTNLANSLRTLMRWTLFDAGDAAGLYDAFAPGEEDGEAGELDLKCPVLLAGSDAAGDKLSSDAFGALARTLDLVAVATGSEALEGLQVEVAPTNQLNAASWAMGPDGDANEAALWVQALGWQATFLDGVEATDGRLLPLAPATPAAPTP